MFHARLKGSTWLDFQMTFVPTSKNKLSFVLQEMLTAATTLIVMSHDALSNRDTVGTFLALHGWRLHVNSTAAKNLHQQVNRTCCKICTLSSSSAPPVNTNVEVAHICIIGNTSTTVTQSIPDISNYWLYRTVEKSHWISHAKVRDLCTRISNSRTTANPLYQTLRCAEAQEVNFS